MVQRDNL